ncbi:MAG: hypothetical protein A2277_04435 [Desulfobacterales bacterium RIFOXYA12_FULL_46_15]|nr:MAG: hypothetical protein A2277_04435 [Desulfobacterales bacterium RIFOXYA12_FULL_46_15]
MAVIDLHNEPLRVFECLEAHTLNRLDFLFPDGTHENTPPGITRENFRSHREYADWLINIFDFWFDRGEHKKKIRLFDNILALLIGGQSDTEGIGEQSLSFFTIETDGEIRDSDVLGVAFEHASRFGEGHFLGKQCFEKLMNSNDFQTKLRQYSPASLSSECSMCYWRDICGGGFLAHRYSVEGGFSNPSIYCGNIQALLKHVRARIKKKLVQHGEQSETTKNKIITKHGNLNFCADAQSLSRMWDIPISAINKIALFSNGNHSNPIKNSCMEIPVSRILTPEHPDFYQTIEREMFDVVHFLVHKLNCIIYSNRLGHCFSNDQAFQKRKIGLLCRDREESLYLLGALKNSSLNRGKVSVGIEMGRIVAKKGKSDTIEITFLPNEKEPAEYFSSVNKASEEFILNLNKEFSQPPTVWEIPANNSAEIEIEDIRDIFSDYSFSDEIAISGDKFIVSAKEPYYRNEALAVRHYARVGNIAIVNNHAWASLFWTSMLSTMTDCDTDSSYQIIHIDYHSDLMMPKLFYSPEVGTFIDFFTKKPVFFDDKKTIEKAIYSTAIGPGSFLLPFFYLQKERWIRYDHIYPGKIREKSDSTSRRYNIANNGPPILKQCGSTLLLRNGAKKKKNIEIRSHSAEISEFPAIVGDIIFLDIDLDFFSNKMGGTTDWRTNPGWHPNDEELQKLFDYVQGIVEKIALSGKSVIISIATSNNFCPPEVSSPALQQLIKFFKTAGLIRSKEQW